MYYNAIRLNDALINMNYIILMIIMPLKYELLVKLNF